MPFSLQSKAIDFQKFPNRRDEADKPIVSVLPGFIGSKAVDLGSGADRNIFPSVRSSIQGVSAIEKSRKDDGLIGSRKQDMNSMMDLVASYKHENDAWGHKVSRDACSIESQKGGRMRSLVVNWDAKERSSTCQEPTSSIPHGTISAAKMLPTNVFQQRGYLPSAEKEMVSASDEDAIAGVMEQHGQFVSSMQSRSAKLQIVYRYWEKSDVKTVISAMAKMADNAVVADVISIMTVNIDVVTLDICTCLLPLLTGLLESDIDRHLSISLDMLLKVVRIFGSAIYSTLSASSSVGVDIEAEQRRERCNLCFIELEKVKRSLPALTRTRVSVAESAQELNLALQEVS